MYGYRNSNNTIRNFVLTFLAGWLFGQVFTIQPKTDFESFKQNQVFKRN